MALVRSDMIALTLLPEEEAIIGPDDDDEGPVDDLPGDLWF